MTFGGEEVDEDLKDFNEEFDDVEIRQDRLEHIINQQPILLNNVRLRQNPHDVKQWLFRVKLFTDPSKGAVTDPDPIRAVTAFTEGVKTVDPMKAVGRLSLLWIDFAKFYEKYDDLENANNVFSKASQVAFKTVDELASVWSEWIEMFLRHDLLEEAYQTCLRSVTPPRRLTPEEYCIMVCIDSIERVRLIVLLKRSFTSLFVYGIFWLTWRNRLVRSKRQRLLMTVCLI